MSFYIKLLPIILCLVTLTLSNFYMGMFKKQDLLVAQDRIYKERVPFRVQYANYGKRFRCPITFLRVVDRLGYGVPPKTKVIRGGLRKPYVTLRLSAYNKPISVTISVGCANLLTTSTTKKTKTIRSTSSSIASTSIVTTTKSIVTAKPTTTPTKATDSTNVSKNETSETQKQSDATTTTTTTTSTVKPPEAQTKDEQLVWCKSSDQDCYEKIMSKCTHDDNKCNMAASSVLCTETDKTKCHRIGTTPCPTEKKEGDLPCKSLTGDNCTTGADCRQLEICNRDDNKCKNKDNGYCTSKDKECTLPKGHQTCTKQEDNEDCFKMKDCTGDGKDTNCETSDGKVCSADSTGCKMVGEPTQQAEMKPVNCKKGDPGCYEMGTSPCTHDDNTCKLEDSPDLCAETNKKRCGRIGTTPCSDAQPANDLPCKTPNGVVCSAPSPDPNCFQLETCNHLDNKCKKGNEYCKLTDSDCTLPKGHKRCNQDGDDVCFKMKVCKGDGQNTNCETSDGTVCPAESTVCIMVGESTQQNCKKDDQNCYEKIMLSCTHDNNTCKLADSPDLCKDNKKKCGRIGTTPCPAQTTDEDLPCKNPNEVVCVASEQNCFQLETCNHLDNKCKKDNEYCKLTDSDCKLPMGHQTCTKQEDNVDCFKMENCTGDEQNTNCETLGGTVCPDSCKMVEEA